jgi:hypothetical protein
VGIFAALHMPIACSFSFLGEREDAVGLWIDVYTSVVHGAWRRLASRHEHVQG